jgi:NAD-dependent SIR2 family protein deacetylase
MSEKPELSAENKNPLFEAPELISPEQGEVENRDQLSSFQSENRTYYLGAKDGKVFFGVDYYDALPDELTEEERTKFIKEKRKINGKERDVYVFRFGEVPELLEQTQITDISEEEYLVAPKRDFTEQSPPTPQEINTSQLIELLKSKKVLFYTGAGISMGGSVRGMDDLLNNFQIDLAQETDGFLRRSVSDPAAIKKDLQNFIDAMHKSPATPAHESLARLAQKLKCKIFTENNDTLQEKTGVRAEHISGRWLRENIQREWLKEIDAVITIGLRFDDRGFLGWYKENNPNGKIIAVNLSQPSYVGDEDFLLKGDLQKIIPELEKNL